MQLTPAHLLAFAVSVAASTSLPEVPTCAQTCLTTLPVSCNLNPACICTDSIFMNTISCCVKDACTSAEELKVFDFASELCGLFNVTVTQPKAGDCPKNGTATGSAGPKKTKVAQRDFGF